MRGWIILVSVLLVEIIMMGYSIAKKKNIKTERAYVRIGEFMIAALCLLFRILRWDFKVFGMYLTLLLLAIYSIVVVVNGARGKEKRKDYTTGRTIRHTILMLFVLGFAIVPVVLFPQHKELKTTGVYESEVASYTWTDESRQETLSGKEEPRNVTVDLYYPKEYKDKTAIRADEKFPLIVFSHGAFGYIRSNYSLYRELASNGYIVCSVSHTYHAFITNETNGRTKLVNMQFMQEAEDASHNKFGIEKEYEVTQEWLSVRTGDLNFVIDQIEKMAEEAEEPAFVHMDTKRIGMMGHSLGGGASVEIARQRSEVGAVMVLDGTHIGEYIGIENGSYKLREDPLNVPVLDMRSEEFGLEMKQLDYQYVNDHTVELSPEGRSVIIMGTAHMNFTDLPLFSPFLAKLLGTGSCNPTACTEQIDSIALEWFNHYLKGNESLSIQDVYTIK